MEFIDLLRVVRRWIWLIVALVVIVQVGLGAGMWIAGPAYTAVLRLQISTPQREDVSVYDERYSSISLRDEITVAINNFIDLLNSDEVVTRTIGKLGLQGKDAKYDLEARQVSDADYVEVAVTARAPDLAAEIANTHADAAIAYYGELRAKVTIAERDLFAEELRAAQEEFQAAEVAFSNFQAEHGIASLDSQLTMYGQLLQQLELERDHRLLQELTTALAPEAKIDDLIDERQKEMEHLLSLAPTYDVLEQDVQLARDRYRLQCQGSECSDSGESLTAEAEVPVASAELLAAGTALYEFQTENGISSLENQLNTQQELLEQLLLERDQRLLDEITTVTNPVAEVDRLIAERQKRLDELTALAPAYNLLEQKVEQTRDAYQLLLGKYSEAEVKVTAVQAANFVQVVKPAFPPTAPDSSWPKLAVLAFAGSLGLGIMLAFLLNYLAALRTVGAASPAGEQAPTPEAAADREHSSLSSGAEQ